MKMSDVFNRPLFCKKLEVGERCAIYEEPGITVAASFYSNDDFRHEAICHAVNNYDRLTQENQKLREIICDAYALGLFTESHDSSTSHKLLCREYKQLLSKLEAKDE